MTFDLVWTTIFFFPIIERAEDMFFVVAFFDEYYPNWALLFKVIYYSCFFQIGHASLIIVNLFVYIIKHITFQIYILNSHINNISKISENEINYQQLVTKKLIFCIKLNKNIKM